MTYNVSSGTLNSTIPDLPLNELYETVTLTFTVVQTGAKVYLACRSLERAQHAVDDIVNQTGISSSQLPILQLDLNSLKSVRSFASSFKRSKLITSTWK